MQRTLWSTLFNGMTTKSVLYESSSVLSRPSWLDRQHSNWQLLIPRSKLFHFATGLSSYALTLNTVA